MKKKIMMIGMSVLMTMTTGLKAQMLTDTAKYHTKVSETFFISNIELEDGSGEKRTCKYVASTKNMSNDEIKLVSNTLTAFSINLEGEYACKNTYSWKPREILVWKNDKGELMSSIEGSAENSYGSRGKISVYMSIDSSGNTHMKFAL